MMASSIPLLFLNKHETWTYISKLYMVVDATPTIALSLLFALSVAGGKINAPSLFDIATTS